VTLGWIALVVMIIAGSTMPVFGKQLTEHFSPLSMLFLSEVMTLAFAILTFGFYPILKTIKHLKQSIILPLVTAGVFNGVVAAVFWFTGLERTSAVNTELFGNTEMLFLMIFGALFVNQPLRRPHWIGGGIILAGLLIVGLKGFTEGITFASGDALIILACLCYGIGGILVRKYLRKVDPEVVIFARSSTAIAFFFLISPFISHPFIEEVRQFPWELIFVLLAYGFISRFLLIFSYYEAIDRLPIPTVSLLSMLIVVGGTLFAHLYLGEPVAWYQATGAVLIIAGAVVVEWAGLHRFEEHFVHYMKAHRQR